MSRSTSSWGRLLIGLVVVAGGVAGCRGDLKTPLFVISGPTGLQSFQLTEEDGGVLWSVVAAEPTTLSRIDYGLVPDGFRQVTPEGNEPPRALIPGEWLRSEIVGVEGTFHHEGVATGPDSFQPLTSKMVLQQSDSSSLD